MRFLLLFALLLNFFGAPTSSQAEDSPVARSSQVIMVTSPDWGTVTGTMWLLERSQTDWKTIDSWPVVVGRKGLGWGKGVHLSTGEGPIKKEGDGKSPAGVFTLSSAFGTEPVGDIKKSGLKLPYLHLSSMIECVDDTKSTNYNRIVVRTQHAQPDWTSSEKMAEYAKEYHLGVVVDHNTNPRKQGDGSCIFIHIWKNDQTGTSGCTAMESKNMEKLVSWLDPDQNPVLVQLPEAEYQRLRYGWKLPRLK